MKNSFAFAMRTPNFLNAEVNQTSLSRRGDRVVAKYPDVIYLTVMADDTQNAANFEFTLELAEINTPVPEETKDQDPEETIRDVEIIEKLVRVVKKIEYIEEEEEKSDNSAALLIVLAVILAAALLVIIFFFVKSAVKKHKLRK